MTNLKLDRNKYEALRSLLAELEDIEDTKDYDGNPERFMVIGTISRDSMELLRAFVGLDKLL